MSGMTEEDRCASRWKMVVGVGVLVDLSDLRVVDDDDDDGQSGDVI